MRDGTFRTFLRLPPWQTQGVFFMKLATVIFVAALAIPTAALADSSQPNSAPGLEGQPVTNQGEGTTGMNRSSEGTTGSAAMIRRDPTSSKAADPQKKSLDDPKQYGHPDKH
jgi:hypothetical protein